VVVELQELGLAPANVETTVRRAQRRGLTAAEARQIAAHYRASPESWRSVGVVIAALRAAMPNKDAAACFPAPATDELGLRKQREARNHRLREQAAAEQAEAARQAEAEKAEARRLEQAHGATWDGLTEDARRELLAQLGNAFLLTRPLDSPLVREAALEFLARRPAP
jgi:hypothetical protein